MADPLQAFPAHYRSALARFAATPGEETLAAALDVGRAAVAAGLGPLELVEAHHDALRGTARDDVEAAGDFLRDALSVFEFERLGYDEAQHAARAQHEHAQRLSALLDAATAISATLDEEQLLGLLAAEGARLMGAERAVASAAVGKRIVTSEYGAASAGEPTLTLALRGRRGQEVGGLRLEGLPHEATAVERGIGAQLAQAASFALANAALYRHEREIAQTLQRSLLPPTLPAIAGLEVAARYLPAGEGLEVGGDFYDLFAAPAGRWALAVGDVCGKGAEAAGLTALVRHTIRAVEAEPHAPREVLARLNDALLEQHSDRRFCTVVLAHLHMVAGGGLELDASCGGHPSPLVLRADGRVEEVECAGTVLGVVEEPDLIDQRAHLAPGDAILFYTDGVTEVRRGGQVLFDESDLRRVLAARGGARAGALADAVVEAALGAAGGRPRDDIALLALSVPR